MKHKRMTPDEFVTEVQWLLSFGMPAADAANALETNPKAAARRLHRAGRGDLASPFESEGWRS